MQKIPYYSGVRIKRTLRINVTDNGLTVSTVRLNYETTFCHAIKHTKMELLLGKRHFE